MPYTPNSTWVDGSGGGTPLSAARLNNLESGVTVTYDAVTPTLTNGAVGNGTISGKYMQRGKFVHYWGIWTLGSTSTITGPLSISIPAAAVTARLGTVGRLVDASSANQYHIQGGLSASAFAPDYLTAWNSTGASINTTAPFVWTTSDKIEWNFVYEAA